MREACHQIVIIDNDRISKHTSTHGGKQALCVKTFCANWTA
jgi:hypothetical protein